MSILGVSGSLGCTGSIGPSGSVGPSGFTGIGGVTGVSGHTGYQGTSIPMYKCYHCDNLFWLEEITEVELEENSQVLCKSCCRDYRIEELTQPTFDLEV